MFDIVPAKGGQIILIVVDMAKDGRHDRTWFNYIKW